MFLLKRWFPYFYIARILQKHYHIRLRLELGSGLIWYATLVKDEEELLIDVALCPRKAAWRLLKRIENYPFPKEYKKESYDPYIKFVWRYLSGR